MSIRQGLLICDACWRQSNVSPDMLAKSKRAEAQRQGWTVAVRRSIGGLGDYCNSCSQKGSQKPQPEEVEKPKRYAFVVCPHVENPMNQWAPCLLCKGSGQLKLELIRLAPAEFCRWVKSYPYGEKL